MQRAPKGYGKLRMDTQVTRCGGAISSRQIQPGSPETSSGLPGLIDQPRSRITSRTRATIVPALGICCISTVDEKLIGV